MYGQELTLVPNDVTSCWQCSCPGYLTFSFVQWEDVAVQWASLSLQPKYWLRRLKSGTVRRDEVQETAGRDIQRKVLRNDEAQQVWQRRLLPTKFLPSVKCPHGPRFCSLVCCTIVNMFSLQTCLLTVPNNIYSIFCTRHASTYRNV